LFVGIGYQLVQVLQLVRQQVHEIRTYSGNPGSGAIFDADGNIIGGTPPPPPPVQPPAQLVAGLALQNRLPVYLGTAEITPTIDIERFFLPWYDDEMGTSDPADELYEGDSATVTALVNRWYEPVYAFLACLVNRAPLGGLRGFNLPQEIGSSLVMEGFTSPLWVQFPFFAKTVMGGDGFMPPCYRFFNAHLTNDRLEPLNHEPRKTLLVWQCKRYLDVVSGASGLYDHDMFNPPLPVVN